MNADSPAQATLVASSPAGRWARVWPYVLAVVASAGTLGARLAFASWFGSRPALVLFVLPIFLSAYVGGLGPGLVSTAIFALGSAYYLMPPIHSFAMANSVDTVLWLVLVLIGVLISVLNGALHRSRQRDAHSIAQLRATHERLGRSEHRFRALLEHSADGVALIDADNKILYLSPSVSAIEGYAPEELIGRNGTENTHPEDLPLVDKVVQQLVAHPGQPIPVLWRRRHKDGRWLWLEGVATNLLPDPGVGAIVTNYRDVTERKRSEARFRRLVDSNAQGVIFWNTQGEITEANDAFLDLVGYTRADLKAGQVGWAAMTPPEYAHLDQEALAELATKGVCTPFEKEYIRKDGARVPVLIGAAIFEDSPGEGVCFVLDITARKQAEVRYRILFDTLIEGFCTIEMIFDEAGKPVDYRFLEINPAFEKQTGLHNAQGRLMRELAPEHEEHWFEIYGKIARTGEPVQFENEARALGRHYDVCAYRVGGPESRKVAILFNDITERKRTEQALRASEEHFRFLNELVEETRTLADPALIMAVMARLLGEHLRASRCAYADVEKDGELFTILHDYTDGCASTVGQYQLSLFGPRAVATLQGGQTLIIRNVAAELPPGEGGEMFTAIGIQAIITCPLVKEGALRAMMAVHQTAPRDWQPREIALVQDVVERCWATIERRTAEEKIRQLNAELEQRVIERTAQLAAANRELEAFSYSVSHDLRAPLRAVDGFSQAVLQDFGAQLPEAGRRHLQVIRESAQRMGALIDDLLTFSRLGRQELRKGPVDIQRLVQDALQELGALAADPRVEIRTGELPSCLGDRALLKQVWLNLLDNALKYSRRRDPAIIEIGSEHRGAGVVYHVRDNGTGFDMQYAGKLFGVFQRLHRMEDYEGTGVGLATVQRIIHRHGGRVWAEAAPERGATFYFTLNGETNHD